MSPESSGKKLTTALESLSITNEITTSDNQKSISAFFTPNILDAIDSIRQTKKKALRGVNFDQDSGYGTISEIIKLNLIINKKTPQGLYSFYRTSADDISTCEMKNLLVQNRLKLFLMEIVRKCCTTSSQR